MFNTDILCVSVSVCVLTLTLFLKLCHTLTHPADKDRRRRGGEKEVRRRGQEASFPKGNEAQVKKRHVVM